MWTAKDIVLAIMGKSEQQEALVTPSSLEAPAIRVVYGRPHDRLQPAIPKLAPARGLVTVDEKTIEYV